MEGNKLKVVIVGDSSTSIKSYKENSMGYSDEWQPYLGDYDKFEYDIKLKDGTIVENCYPNGGSFNSISDEHNGQRFTEGLVEEIRFSAKPRYGLNSKVSSVPQYEWWDERRLERERREIDGDLPTSFTIDDPYIIYQNFPYDVGMNYQKPPQYIRSEPKVHNNAPCKCGSGKKFKKCCK